MLCLLTVLVVIVMIADFITRRVLVQAFNSISEKTKTKFDDYLVKYKTPKLIAHIIPLLITLESFPIVFVDYPNFEIFGEKALKIYAVLLIIWVFKSVFHALETLLKTIPRLKNKPIDSYIQVVMIVIWIIGIAFIFVIFTDVSIVKFFTTLGAASAILLLLFKDTIMGFVASIQVAVNDTIRIGDWITMDKYNADGTVIEINLNTVQVQNFDNTITYIPTYALMSDAFTNWRGMSNSGGRRIKRALLIKPSSIKYLDAETIAGMKNIALIKDYIDTRQNDITDYNTKNNIDKSLLINGRNLTNLGLFRKYLQTYVENHSAINKEMTIMIRQLAPSSQGIPLEIYAFSKDQRWVNYEYIMADIFDHSIAAVPYFELELFELSNFDPKLS